MLLFNPSPGQITDRKCILTLKIEAQRRNGVEPLDLFKERKMCEVALESKLISLSRVLFLDYNRLSTLLAEQNMRQWGAENNIRKALKNLSEIPISDELQEVVYWAKKTHLGNERRSKLIAEIDKLFGIEPEVKVYS